MCVPMCVGVVLKGCVFCKQRTEGLVGPLLKASEEEH